MITIIKVTSQLMVRTAFDHFCDMLRLLVDWHGSDDAAMWRRGGEFDLDRTGLGNLTVEFLQQWGVLEEKRPRTRHKVNSLVHELRLGYSHVAHKRSEIVP